MARAGAEGMKRQISCCVWCVSDVVGVVGMSPTLSPNSVGSLKFTAICYVSARLLTQRGILLWYDTV